MPQASFVQTNFLGGEWSPYAQGRLEDKLYRNGMNICLNGYPIETGLWTRRQGTRFCATTRYGQPAWLLPLFFAQNQPYTLEFTNLFLRMFQGPTLVGTNDVQTVLSISAANPAVVTTGSAHGWSSGNMVYFIFKQSGGLSGAKTLFMRQFVITVLTGTTFSIADPISGLGIDGSTITLPAISAQVIRVEELASPYTSAQIQQVNKVQAEGTLVTLQSQTAPYALVQTTAPADGTFAQFSFNPAIFLDGPYQDVNTVGSLQASGLSGTITLTAIGITPFVSTDVGRQVRLFSEPANWASGTAYTTGNIVKGPDSLYYTALANSTGKQPDLNPVLWAVNPSAAIWTWATITVFTDTSHVTATVNGPALLYSGSSTPINTFRLGLYSATTGYPTCGLWHEGRLWLAGAQGNRIDASMNGITLAAGTFQFSPTSTDGTVSDNNGIAYVFNAEDVNDIFWLLPDGTGIVAGTQGGEWVVSASNQNDPLTPTSMQAHRRSKYKAANTQAVHAGFSLLFVQAQQRKLIEYTADVFSGKFLGRNLSEMAKHLADGGYAQIAYQQELTPVVWARTQAGGLNGTTYKRESSFTSEPPTFNGWHEHNLGSTRLIESLSVGPSVNGNLESLTMVTNQTNPLANDYNIRHVEILTDLFDENSDITDAWFVDDALTPSAATENLAATQVTFYGYYHLIGKTVSGWIGGIDAGDAVVQSDGSITFNINVAGSIFTDANLNLLTTIDNFDGLGTYLDRTVNVQKPVLSGASVQSYIATNQPNNYFDDYPNNRIFSIKSGVAGLGAASSIAQFNRLTGVKAWETTQPQLFPAPNTPGYAICSIGSLALDATNNFMYFPVVSGNGAIIGKFQVTPTGLVNIGQFFGSGGSSFIPTNKNVPTPQNSLVCSAIGRTGVAQTISTSNSVLPKNYFVFQALGSASNSQLVVMDADLMTYAGHTYIYPDTGASGTFRGMCVGETVSNGRAGSSVAIYSSSLGGTQISIAKTVITGPVANRYYNPPTAPVNSNVNPGIVTTNLVSIAIASIDGTWASFTNAFGPWYDPTDGNIIVGVQNILSGTPSYIVKINAFTGSIMWKTAVDFQGQTNAFGLDQNVMTDGITTVLNTHVSSGFNVVSGAGAITNTTSVPSITGANANCVDNDGTIVGIMSWTGATLNGLNGTTAFGGYVGKLQGFAGFPGDTTETKSQLIPAVIGFTYTSQGQLLRPQAPDATGARQGPGFGKTRRLHRYTLQLANSQGVSAGTSFAKLFPTPIRDFEGGPPYALNQLFTGIISELLENNYSYDGMLCWQITRPYPCNVVAAGGMIETEDR